MFDFKPDYLICGGINGDLHLVKNTSLYFEKDCIQNEIISPDNMCYSKSYTAHISFVNQCEYSLAHKEFLFTSGIDDECIIKWQFTQEELI